MGISPQTYTKNDIQKGTMAELPPHPLKGDFFIVLPDPPEQPLSYLAVCFNDEEWTLQEIPVENPLTIDESGTLLFNGNPIIPAPNTETLTYSSDTTGFKEILSNRNGVFTASVITTAGAATQYIFDLRMSRGGSIIDSWTSDRMPISPTTAAVIPDDILLRFKKELSTDVLEMAIKKATDNRNTVTTIISNSGSVKV